MKKHWKKAVLAGLFAVLGAYLSFAASEFITFEELKRNSNLLSEIVRRNYLPSVGVLGFCFLTTAFFVPGALLLTIAAGFLFGPVAGALYATAFSTLSSTLAFFLSRHLIGNWVQRRYRGQLRRFNDEIARHGSHYLFVMRVVPLMPSFLINYLSGLTRISAFRFALFSFLGMLPGASIYACAGRQLRLLESPGDILSVKMLIGFLLLAGFALLPVLYRALQRAFRSRK